MTRRAAALLLAVAGALGSAAACGDGDGTESIDSGLAVPSAEVTTSTTTTTTTPPDDDDDRDDDEGDGDRGDHFPGNDDVTIVDCDDDDSPDVSGSDEVVAIIGRCDEVDVNGDSHQVVIESADTVEVSGHGHRVQVDDAGEIRITGSQHDVRHSPGATIDNTSVDSHVAVIEE